MAKVLADFEINGKGRRTIYPWDEWLDGQIWQLTRGEDFKCKVLSFRMAAKYAAVTRGLNVDVQVRGDTVTIQAIKAENGTP